MRVRGRLLALAALAVLASALVSGSVAAAPAAPSGEQVLFAANCRKPVYQPKRIVVACADANFLVRGITWTSWTQTAASGRGTASINDCTPSCAAGTFRTYPVRVVLSAPRVCREGAPRQFVRIAIAFTGERPAGYPPVDRFHYGCGFGSS